MTSGQIEGPNDGIFGIEENLVSDGSATEVYVTLDDPTKLGLDFYTVLISITDDTMTVPSVPPCDDIIANVSIIITADLSPVFIIPPGGYIGYLPENSPIGTFIITIIAKSYDGSTGNIKYQLKDGKGLFEIGRDSGDITTISADVDFELIQEYTLVVEAQDRSTEPFRSSTVTVIINVNNTNDNCPEFGSTFYAGQISLQDLFVADKDTLDRLVLVAYDVDMTFDGDIELLPGPGNGVFAIDEDRSITGQSRVFIRLLDDDQLTDSSYALQILASDPSAVPSVDCSGTPVDVLVEVVSDFAPNFTLPEYSGNIIEAAPIGTFVVQVEATSQSAKPDIVYILKSVSNNGGSLFAIDRISGIITVESDQTDYEDLTQYTLVVEAQDRGIEPFRSATTTVFVYLGDANDNCPDFRQDTYTGVISAYDLYVVTGSGSTERLVLTAFDDDTRFIGTFNLESGPGTGIFNIVTYSDPGDTEIEVYIQLLDPELLADPTYILEITTTDAPRSCVINKATITVNVVEDLAPKFDQEEYFGNVREGANIGFLVVQVNATSQNAGTAEISYSVKSGTNGGLILFDVDKNSGWISVISDQTNYESVTEYTLVVEAQDRGTEPPRFATTVVIISITDENDVCPEWDEIEYFGQITTEDIYVVQEGAVEYLVLRASDGDTVRRVLDSKHIFRLNPMGPTSQIIGF
ncbi:cadherin EGF LAG seven-pass G-type receptor 2-like [Amphiura filiformis]|uniref:cadherin EGF LAG seven-pass G-type receptor 2-like n=1 Tax=Amphiura filiformis TaxID=82378 RepID=UPI003B20C924